jgi:hypothetical protein
MWMRELSSRWLWKPTRLAQPRHSSQSRAIGSGVLLLPGTGSLLVLFRRLLGYVFYDSAVGAFL